jgi:hypothetical protein
MNNKIVPGPEDIPQLGYVKTFKMMVTIFDKDDRIIREQEIDYGNHENRKWLGRVTFWACSNGMTVETSASK